MRNEIQLEDTEMARLAELLRKAIAAGKRAGQDTSADEALLQQMEGNAVEIKVHRGNEVHHTEHRGHWRRDNRRYVGRNIAGQELNRLNGDWVAVYIDGVLDSAIGRVPLDVLTELANRFPDRYGKSYPELVAPQI